MGTINMQLKNIHVRLQMLKLRQISESKTLFRPITTFQRKISRNAVKKFPQSYSVYSEIDRTIIFKKKGTSLALKKRLILLLTFLLLSRLGVYVPLSSKIDITAFIGAIKSEWGVGYIDALTGGSINKASLFSLGIVPFINASIVMQIMASLIPSLKKLSQDEGVSGRRKFLQYQKLLTLSFALFLALGQLNYIRPFVTECSIYWIFENSIVLATGAIILTFLSEEIDKLKLGNGTSLLIFSNILSTLPSFAEFELDEVSATLLKNIFLLIGSFMLAILGIVYVQEAEMKIPINYTSRFYSEQTEMDTKSFLPLKVNATGVMPIIFASSILALPEVFSRLTDIRLIKNISTTLNASNSVYGFYALVFIFLFNYLYTLLQLDPCTVS